MAGRHFLQIPGPTNVPERILRAMDRAVVDHRGPELPAVVNEAVAGLRQVFGTTRGEIILYPASGTGAWEASLVNTLNPGDRALAFPCRNAPVEVLLVRASDVPEYVQDGVVDCGITGIDLVREQRHALAEELERLRMVELDPDLGRQAVGAGVDRRERLLR